MSITNPVTAFLVEPATRSITPYSMGETGFKNIASLIKSGSGYVDIITISEDGDVVYVDDEGRMNGAAEKFGKFWLRGSEGCALVVGNGLLLGTDGDGECCDPELSQEDFTKMVVWEQPSDCDDDGRPRMQFIPLS